MTKQRPSFFFGAAMLSTTLSLSSDSIFGHLTSCGDDDFALWLGVNYDEPDAIISGLEELRIFRRWLAELPANPHANLRVEL